MDKNDCAILKIITPPSLKELEYLTEKTKEQARKIGLRKEDIKSAIKKARKK